MNGPQIKINSRLFIFLPIAMDERCTTWKVVASDACKEKHKTFLAQLRFLSELQESKRVLISHRYKFDLMHFDLAGTLSYLESTTCALALKNFRWLVVKEELDYSRAAAAVALSTTPGNVKIVMTVSQFVPTLGCRVC